MAKKRTRRSSRFVEFLRGFARVDVVSHDNPDPDAIATGWAVAELVNRKVEKPVRVLAGGAIFRAENLRMVEILKPPLQLVDRWEPAEGTAVVLVDCTPSAQNHLLRGTDFRAAAVLDHHEVDKNTFRAGFRDIRPRVAALSSMAAEYLREQEIEPGPNLASALIYAIRTETTGWEAVFSRTDRRSVSWLNHFYDPGKLNEIENAPLARHYFGDLLLALENTFIYENAALCFLPRASGPEIVAEVADLLIRCRGVERVLCTSLFGGALLISARTSRTGGDAVALLARAIKNQGACGGHRHRAGGKIGDVDSRTDAEEVSTVLRNNFLNACGIQQLRGSRLVAKRDIVLNL